MNWFSKRKDDPIFEPVNKNVEPATLRANKALLNPALEFTRCNGDGSIVFLTGNACYPFIAAMD